MRRLRGVDLVPTDPPTGRLIRYNSSWPGMPFSKHVSLGYNERGGNAINSNGQRLQQKTRFYFIAFPPNSPLLPLLYIFPDPPSNMRHFVTSERVVLVGNCTCSSGQQQQQQPLTGIPKIHIQIPIPI